MSRKMFSSTRAYRVSATTGVLLGLALSGQSQVLPRITTPVDPARMVTLKGNTLPVASAAYDLGRVPDETPSGRVLMVLKHSAEQQAALDKLVQSQQSAGSASFHKWLTTAQYASQFGAADADIQTVTGYLASQGFTVKQVLPNKMGIEFSGTAGQLRTAFKTEIHTYNVNGQKFSANDRDPQIPNALTPVVEGFASLNNYHPASKTPAPVRKTADLKHTGAHALYTDQVNGALNVAPGDIAKIYDIPGTSTGTGVSIGVVSTSNVNLVYIANYQKTFGLTVKNPTIVVDGDDPGEASNESQVLAQLELLSAVAPAATIRLYTTTANDPTSGENFAIARAVNDGLVQVLVYDFESCEANLGSNANGFNLALAEQAAAEGMTVIAGAGDGGSDSCESSNGYGNSGAVAAASKGLSVNGYASPPFVTAVGATDFYYSNPSPSYAAQFWNENETTSFTSALKYIPEQPWNLSDGATNGLGSDGIAVATGGGFSTAGLTTTSTGPYPVPFWQSPYTSSAARAVPDVAMFGGSGLNGSAYMVCVQADECINAAPEAITYETAGGTSVASAAFAGIAALVVQAHGAQGNINPVLYSLYGSANQAAIFHAAAAGTNTVACIAGSPNCGGSGYLEDSGALAYTATSSYNPAVGLGSVDVAHLIADWASPATIATTTVFNLTLPYGTVPVSSFVHGTALQANIAVTSGSGTVAGDVAVITTSPLPGLAVPAWYTLVSGSVTDNVISDILPGGTYQLYAKYAGNTQASGGGIFAPSVSTPFTVTVTPETSQMQLTSSFAPGASITYGTPISVSASVFSGTQPTSNGIPTGSVTVTDNNQPLTIVPIDAFGLATFTGQLSANKFHSLNFSYPGDLSYQASSATTTLTINAQPTSSFLSSTSTFDARNDYVQLVAVVSASGSAPNGIPPTGTVSFTTGTGGTTIGTAVLVPGQDSSGRPAGIAHYQLHGATLLNNPNVGSTFVPTAGSGYAASLSNQITLSTVAPAGETGTKASTTSVTTVDGAATYFDYAGSVSFNSTVTGASGTPTGTVTFYSNGVALGAPAALSNTGVATLTVSQSGSQGTSLAPLTIGQDLITAQYNGDTVYAGSTHETTITILDEGSLPDFALQSNVTYGILNSSSASTQFSFQLTSFNNYAALGHSVTFGVTAPAGITCSLTSKTVSFSTTSPNLALTNFVTCGPANGYTVAAALPANRPSGRFWLSTGGAAFACVFLLGIPARRRGWQGILGALLLTVVSLSAAAGLTACGSNALRGGNAFGQSTPAADAQPRAAAASSGVLAVGTYQVLVTATGAFAAKVQPNTASTQIHTIPLEISVQ